MAITMYLLNRDLVTAKELAKEFEVSVRTIYRDLDTINEAGIPIIAHQGNQGGFAILENYKISKQLLTHNELLSILMGLQGIKTTLDDKNLKGTMEKIRGLIPDHKENVTDSNNIFIDYSHWGTKDKQREKTKSIRQAIEDNNLISFDYTSMNGKKSQRTIEPMTLLLKGYGWYIYGYCQLRNDYRIFKLTRIKNLNILNKTFKRREKELNEEVYRDALDKNNSTIDITLRFKPKSKIRMEDYFGEEEVDQAEDGYTLVNINLPENEWLYSFILSFGENVEVLQPVYLREIIKEKALRTYKIYN